MPNPRSSSRCSISATSPVLSTLPACPAVQVNTLLVKSRLDDRTKEDAMKEAGVVRTVLEEQQQLHAVTAQVYEVGAPCC